LIGKVSPFAPQTGCRSTTSLSRKCRKTLVEAGGIAGMVGGARVCQGSARRDVAEERSPGHFGPAAIEGGQFWKKLQLAIGQMIMNPPCHRLPGGSRLHTIDEPGDRDAGHRSHAARVTSIPGVTGVVAWAGRAVVVVGISIGIHDR